MAGQSHQHRGPGARWLTEHAITAHSATTSMAWSCTSHEAWLPAKRNPLWRTVGGRPSHGLTAAALQGHHQVRLATCTNRRYCMRGHRQTPYIHGGKVSKQGFQRQKRMLESRLHAREGTSVPLTTETATAGSGSTVIQDPAQILSANHCLFETRMPLYKKCKRNTHSILTGIN